MAKHLRALLNMKSKVAYTHQSVTPGDHQKASRAALTLLEAAGRVTRRAGH
jgi:hypothetical protein